jgi:hypothetical protein
MKPVWTLNLAWLVAAWSFSVGLAAEPPERAAEGRATIEPEQIDLQAALPGITSRLDAILRRLQSLEQRMARVESALNQHLVGPGPPPVGVMGTVGPYWIGEDGLLYNEQGTQVGMWGVNGQPLGMPAGDSPALQHVR